MNKRYLNQTKSIFILFSVFMLFFIAIFGRFATIAFNKKVNNVDLVAFSENRNQVFNVLYAKRGEIYSAQNNAVVFNSRKYKVVAILDNRAVDENGNPDFVEDKVSTAEILSSILGGEKEKYLQILNTTNVYQVEFGAFGESIDQLIKDKIEELNLPGINFMPVESRSYVANGFASNFLGYSSYDDATKNMIGRQGAEYVYNEQLSGINGYESFEANASGSPIDQSQVASSSKTDGMQIYTTFDETMQQVTDGAVRSTQASSGAKMTFAILVDPKTGKILSAAQSPTFDPNTLENVNANVFTDQTFEVGSVMKPITIAAAIDDNQFDMNKTFMSGSVPVDDVVVSDYNKVGWGEIPYSDIICHSANTGITDLILNEYNSQDYRNKLTQFGFDERTYTYQNIVNTSFSGNEAQGKIVFDSPIMKVTTGFGQGSTQSLLQVLRAYTAIANDGVMSEPYFVEKVENKNTGDIFTYKQKTSNPITKGSAIKTREMMRSVLTEGCTSPNYAIDGYDIAGKSGTSQIAGSDGKYLEGDNNYLSSFVSMVPAENPKLMLYTGVMQSNNGSSGEYNTTLHKNVLEKALTYYNIPKTSPETAQETEMITVPEFLDDESDAIQSKISENDLNVVIIGSGKKIIDQSVEPGTRVVKNKKIFLLTDGEDYVCPNFVGWNVNDVLTYSQISGVKIKIAPNTVVISKQSIIENTKIRKDEVIELQ